MQILVANPPRRRRRRKARRSSTVRRAVAAVRRRVRRRVRRTPQEAPNMARRRRRSSAPRRKRSGRTSARGFASKDLVFTGAAAGAGFLAAEIVPKMLKVPALLSGWGNVGAKVALGMALAYLGRKMKAAKFATAMALGAIGSAGVTAAAQAGLLARFGLSGLRGLGAPVNDSGGVDQFAGLGNASLPPGLSPEAAAIMADTMAGLGNTDTYADSI